MFYLNPQSVTEIKDGRKRFSLKAHNFYDIAYTMLCRYQMEQIYERQSSIAYSPASVSVFHLVIKDVVEKI